jgi:cleavage and polyadenylation specificity factor subunit 5
MACTHLSFCTLCPAFPEVTGLRRKLGTYLSPESELLRSPWDIAECVGSWVRPNFDTVFYPYTPPHITRPKEVKKVYIVQLPENCYFGVGCVGPIGCVILGDGLGWGVAWV